MVQLVAGTWALFNRLFNSQEKGQSAFRYAAAISAALGWIAKKYSSGRFAVDLTSPPQRHALYQI